MLGSLLFLAFAGCWWLYEFVGVTVVICVVLVFVYCSGVVFGCFLMVAGCPVWVFWSLLGLWLLIVLWALVFMLWVVVLLLVFVSGCFVLLVCGLVFLVVRVWVVCCLRCL